MELLVQPHVTPSPAALAAANCLPPFLIDPVAGLFPCSSSSPCCPVKWRGFLEEKSCFWSSPRWLPRPSEADADQREISPADLTSQRAGVDQTNDAVPQQILCHSQQLLSHQCDLSLAGDVTREAAKLLGTGEHRSGGGFGEARVTGLTRVQAVFHCEPSKCHLHQLQVVRKPCFQALAFLPLENNQY